MQNESGNAHSRKVKPDWCFLIAMPIELSRFGTRRYHDSADAGAHSHLTIFEGVTPGAAGPFSPDIPAQCRAHLPGSARGGGIFLPAAADCLEQRSRVLPQLRVARRDLFARTQHLVLGVEQ